jgi:hypothetical protein
MSRSGWFLLVGLIGCGSSSEPAAESAPEVTVEAPAAPSEPSDIEIPLPPGAVGALPEEGETELLLCTLDAPIDGGERPAIGAIDWRSDGVLVLASDGALRALEILRSRDCRLRAHQEFAESGTWIREGLDASTVQLAADRVGHLYFGDGTEVMRFEGDTLPTSSLALRTSQLSANPGGDFALARVGHTLVRISGDEVLSHAPEPLNLRARDLTFASLLADGTVLIARRGPPEFVALDGAVEPRPLTMPDGLDGTFHLARPATAGIALLRTGEHAAIHLLSVDGTYERTVGVGDSIDFALEFASPVDGPARVTGMSRIHDRVAYVTFEVTRDGHREGGLVRVSGL